MSDNWTKEELKASVEAYLDMQQKTRLGAELVKKEYYRQLSVRFGRTPKAYEYRMQNISYVLSLLGRDWIPGLRPARNVGVYVAAEIESILAEIEGRALDLEVGFETQVQAEISKGTLPKPVGNKAPKSSITQTTQYERDPKVKAWVLLNAKSICESCGQIAPFLATDGTGFLEVHHIRRLVDGGSDFSTGQKMMLDCSHS